MKPTSFLLSSHIVPKLLEQHLCQGQALSGPLAAALHHCRDHPLTRVCAPYYHAASCDSSSSSSSCLPGCSLPHCGSFRPWGSLPSMQGCKILWLITAQKGGDRGDMLCPCPTSGTAESLWLPATYTFLWCHTIFLSPPSPSVPLCSLRVFRDTPALLILSLHWAPHLALYSGHFAPFLHHFFLYIVLPPRVS